MGHKNSIQSGWHSRNKFSGFCLALVFIKRAPTDAIHSGRLLNLFASQTVKQSPQSICLRPLKRCTMFVIHVSKHLWTVFEWSKAHGCSCPTLADRSPCGQYELFHRSYSQKEKDRLSSYSFDHLPIKVRCTSVPGMQGASHARRRAMPCSA